MLSRTILTFVLVVFTAIHIQTSGADKLQQYLAKMDKALRMYSAPQLIAVHSELEALSKADTTNRLPLYYSAYSGYKLLEMSLGKDSTGLFDRYLPAAVEAAELVSLDKNLASEGKTLLAAIYMMKIAHNWSEAMSLTKPFYVLLAEAQELNPANPRAYYVQGLMKLKTPEMFGGSRDEALKLFSKANACFEAEAGSAGDGPKWGYLECLTWTGQAYSDAGNLETAKFYYAKVLQINPDYAWVKYRLLPELEKKMKNE